MACYNSLLAEQRRHKRQELLAATQAELEALARRGSARDDRRDRREGRQDHQPLQNGKTFQSDEP